MDIYTGPEEPMKPVETRSLSKRHLKRLRKEVIEHMKEFSEKMMQEQREKESADASKKDE
jgi:hypothetical protein